MNFAVANIFFKASSQHLEFYKKVFFEKVFSQQYP